MSIFAERHKSVHLSTRIGLLSDKIVLLGDKNWFSKATRIGLLSEKIVLLGDKINLQEKSCISR